MADGHGTSTKHLADRATSTGRPEDKDIHDIQSTKKAKNPYKKQYI